MSPRTRLVLALVSTVLVGYTAVGFLLGRVFGDTSYGQLAIFNEVVRLVLDAYVEPVNVDRAMAGARQGMADSLDGDSAYLEPEDFRLYQQPVKPGEADLGVVLTRRFSFLMVVAPRSGSPAARAGLRPGDLIKSIDDHHTRQMPAVVAERLLRGAPGSAVKLGILRLGADPFEISIMRERVLPAAPESRMLQDGIGYVKVPEFQPATPDDVRTKVEALKRGGARQLVLDLRNAAYGAPSGGPAVAEIFMHGGLVAKAVPRHGAEQLLQADPSHSVWTGPMVVLTSNGTAGPGEIVAAALVDAGRARLVGERTFGRAGTTQTVPLAEGGLVLTTTKYVSPKGVQIHGEGLKPTFAAEAFTDEDEDLPPSEATSKPDRILEKAIDVLTGKVEAKPAA